MEDIKNNVEETERAIESEEVLELAMADNLDDEEAPAKEEADALTENYTEYELSGLSEAQRKRKMIIDKITTGILILLMASPLLIVIYILLWFVLK